MDYGLIGGLAEGLKQGLSSYDTERKYRDEKQKTLADAEYKRSQDAQAEALKRRAHGADLANKGLMEPEEGVFQLTPESAETKKLEREKLVADTAKARADAARTIKENTVGGRLTEGQKVVDREFAKDYNTWTSGGSKIAESEINKLRGVADQLKKKNVTTGGLTGAFPDAITSNKILSARADVQSTVMNSLKEILGGSFTEKEAERVFKNTWNESDSTENNLTRLNRLVDNLQSQFDAKNSKSGRYEMSGSLADLSPQSKGYLGATASGAESTAGLIAKPAKMSGSAAQSKPPIQQNGFTYTWNPKTGQYE